MVPVLFLYELMLMHAQREGSFSPQGIGEQALEQYARFCQVKSRGDAVASLYLGSALWSRGRCLATALEPIVFRGSATATATLQRLNRLELIALRQCVLLT